MNAFQQFLAARHVHHEFAGSVLSRWGSQYWLKVGSSRISAQSALRHVPALPQRSGLGVRRLLGISRPGLRLCLGLRGRGRMPPQSPRTQR